MKIRNIHQRNYNHPISVLADALSSLSSKNDILWPKEKWMPMVLSNGLMPNSKGGHGPVGYYVNKYEIGKKVEFCFTDPKEFVGIHKFEIIEINVEKTQLKHTIDMSVGLKGFVIWYVAIKWLHDALLEDSLDKVHNLNHDSKVSSPHGLWVKILRKILKEKM